MEVFIILPLLFSIFSAIIANAKGRSALGWFFVGLFLGPFGLLVAAFPSISKEKEEHDDYFEKWQQNKLNKKCPFCAETVLREAIKCRYCGSELPPSENVDSNKNSGQLYNRFDKYAQ